MKFLKFRRTFVEGWRSLFRDGSLTFGTISVLVLSLYIMGITVIFGVVVRNLVSIGERSMNVSVYFESGTDEGVLQEIKSELQNAAGIASVEYVSPDQALAQLRASSQESENIDKSLEILGENPLRPSLVIRAQDPRNYEQIVRDIENARFSSIIYEINYAKNKMVIDRQTTFIGTVEKIGLSLGAAFVFIAILITYNAIRLSMYASRQEFEIMRLVGASNLYIKMPLLFEGMWYGIFAAILAFILLVLTAQFVAPLVGDLVQQGTVQLFFTHSLMIAGGLLLGGIFQGMLGSWFAVKRFLKI